MFLDRNKTYLVIVLSAFVSACSSMAPTHLGKFTFEGTVKDAAGQPVPHAWIKVRGWETLSDASGKWSQVQVVDCGTLAEHVETFEENDAVLVTADGFRSQEEKFVVKHPGYFQSCTPEQTLRFETVLTSASGVVESAAAKTTEPKKKPPRRAAPASTSTKGSYSL